MKNLLFILLAVCLSAAAGGRVLGEEYESLKQKGITALKADDFETAEKVYEQILAEHGNRDHSWSVWYEIKNIKALTELKHLVKESDVLNNRGIVYHTFYLYFRHLGLDEPRFLKEADAAFSRILTLPRNSKRIIYEDLIAGAVKHDIGDHEKAEALYKEAMDAVPGQTAGLDHEDRHNILMDKARYFSAAGDPAKCLETLREAFDLYPDFTKKMADNDFELSHFRETPEYNTLSQWKVEIPLYGRRPLFDSYTYETAGVSMEIMKAVNGLKVAVYPLDGKEELPITDTFEAPFTYKTPEIRGLNPERIIMKYLKIKGDNEILILGEQDAELLKRMKIKPLTESEKENLRTKILQLGADEFQVRAGARKALVDEGVRIKPVLKEFFDDPDAEVRVSAGELYAMFSRQERIMEEFRKLLIAGSGVENSPQLDDSVVPFLEYIILNRDRDVRNRFLGSVEKILPNLNSGKKAELESLIKVVKLYNTNRRRMFSPFSSMMRGRPGGTGGTKSEMKIEDPKLNASLRQRFLRLISSAEKFDENIGFLGLFTFSMETSAEYYTPRLFYKDGRLNHTVLDILEKIEPGISRRLADTYLGDKARAVRLKGLSLYLNDFNLQVSDEHSKFMTDPGNTEALKAIYDLSRDPDPVIASATSLIFLPDSSQMHRSTWNPRYGLDYIVFAESFRKYYSKMLDSGTLLNIRYFTRGLEEDGRKMLLNVLQFYNQELLSTQIRNIYRIETLSPENQKELFSFMMDLPFVGNVRFLYTLGNIIDAETYMEIYDETFFSYSDLLKFSRNRKISEDEIAFLFVKNPGFIRDWTYYDKEGCRELLPVLLYIFKNRFFTPESAKSFLMALLSVYPGLDRLYPDMAASVNELKSGVQLGRRGLGDIERQMREIRMISIFSGLFGTGNSQ